MSGTRSTIIAPGPLPLSVQKTHYATTAPNGTASLNLLASLISGISMRPGDGTPIDQRQYALALSIAHACHVIEDCHQDVKPQRASVPPTLRLLAEKTVRYARRVVVVAFEEEDECTTANLLSHERYAKTRHSFERCVRLLRREVVRALRGGNLELRYSRNRGTFRTSAKDLRSASGCGRSEVACFVNAVCYAVTREVGAFPLPLVTLHSGL